MSTAVWTVFAVATMVGLFAACTVAVVAAVRIIERAVARHRDRRSASRTR